MGYHVQFKNKEQYYPGDLKLEQFFCLGRFQSQSPLSDNFLTSTWAAKNHFRSQSSLLPAFFEVKLPTASPHSSKSRCFPGLELFYAQRHDQERTRKQGISLFRCLCLWWQSGVSCKMHLFLLSSWWTWLSEAGRLPADLYLAEWCLDMHPAFLQSVRPCCSSALAVLFFSFGWKNTLWS